MTTDNIYELILTRLHEGLPGITKEAGATLAQACCVCLSHHSHNDGTQMVVKGAFSKTFRIRWEASSVTPQVRRTWNDMQEATEYGAACLACLLVLDLTEYTIIERSWKGTGFDYWLGYSEDEPLFPPRSRLEVSGILNGTDSQLGKRTKEKIKQTSPSDHLDLPALAVVVEFSRPIAQIATK